ncbi:YncE family protein [Undibacterium sp. TJN25]|uniref:YncE family protein n=1 Tax=Undibacterium sp. TJN25 TaxID=3413056 RepID=UPI003BF0FE94
MLDRIKNRSHLRFSLPLVLAAGVLCSSAPMAAGLNYHVADTQILDGDIKWDYLTFDAEHKRLFITRGDHVDVFDIAAKKVTAVIAGTNGVHGVALAPQIDMGFTSNGKDNSITIFELSTLKILATVPTDKKPDAIIYDPASKRVFSANGDSMNLTVIDPIKQEQVGTIELGGKPEFTVVDGKGRLFVNIEDKNQLVAVDTVKMAMLKKYDLSAVCDEPAGLSIDVATQTLFAGCHNEKMAVVNGNTGKILATPAIGKGSDATVYDAARKLAFSSNGDGTLTIIGAGKKQGFEVKQVVNTMPTARTMALDPVSHTIYLVAAQTEAVTPAEKSAEQRPKLKPGTFTLITVAPQ